MRPSSTHVADNKSSYDLRDERWTGTREDNAMASIPARVRGRPIGELQAAWLRPKSPSNVKNNDLEIITSNLWKKESVGVRTLFTCVMTRRLIAWVLETLFRQSRSIVG